MIIVKGINTVFQTGSAFLIYLIGKKLFSIKTSFILSVVFILAVTVNVKFWPGHIMLLSLCPFFIFIYYLFDFTKNNLKISLFLSSFFLSLSFLLSTNFIFFTLIYPIMLYYIYRNSLKTLYFSLISLFGFLIPLAFFLFYLAINNAFNDWYWWSVEWASIYSSHYSLLRKIWSFLDSFRIVWQWTPLLIFSFTGFFLLMKEKTWSLNKLLIIVVFFISLISRLMFKGAERYSLYLLPVFILLLGVFLEKKIVQLKKNISSF
ncbi:MAG: hypothetical protein A2Y41_11395 [Spirochaetes bacterium GWB1_36_13]|nr:MAG: hypothetical protein A2Y41_11395 [Spirochaetes bacterium GWB1_36_13]